MNFVNVLLGVHLNVMSRSLGWWYGSMASLHFRLWLL